MINPLLLILQSISGGVAGYITNKYAVNMLFKEYTPLKLGGVVKKNKEKFIDEISTLVEKDIINGKTFLYYFKNLSELFIPYIENSNLILINNCKEITNKEIDEIYHIISSINYSGHILFSDDNSAILNELRKSNLFLNNKYRKIKMNFRKRFN